MEEANDGMAKYEDMCHCHGKDVHCVCSLKWAGDSSQSLCWVYNILTDVRRAMKTTAERVSTYGWLSKAGVRQDLLNGMSDTGKT